MKNVTSAKESIRNVELGTKGMSSEAITTLAYQGIREVVLPFVEGLDKYKDYDEIEKALKEFSEMLGTRDDENESLIMGILDNADENDLISYFGAKAIGKFSELYKDFDKDKAVEWLEEKSKSIEREGDEELIIKDLDNFYQSCKNCKPKSGEYPECKKYLESAKKKVEEVIDKRNQIRRDLKNATGYILYIGANVLKNMKNEEFEEIKQQIAEAITGELM